MFFIGPPIGTFNELTRSMINYLDSIFEESEKQKQNELYQQIRATQSRVGLVEKKSWTAQLKVSAN